MKESHTEKVANHGGPESCADVREGGGEALTGVRAGRAIEPRNQGIQGADAVIQCERQYRWQRYAQVVGITERSPDSITEIPQVLSGMAGLRRV